MSVLVPLPDELRPAPRAVVVLDGFALRALDNPAGWNVGGLGLSVALSPDRTQVQVTARIRPAESPHPGIFGLGGWDWDQPARHDLDVRWRLIEPALPPTPWTGTAHVASAITTAPPLVPPLPPGTALLTGFDLRFDAPRRLRRMSGYLRNLNGRYLRELGVGIERTAGGDRAFVRASNAPHPLIRVGSISFLALLVAGSALVASSGGFGVALGVAILGFLVGASFIWPRLWLQGPAVPFELEASVDAVVLDEPGEAWQSSHVHRPDPDGLSVS